MTLGGDRRRCERVDGDAGQTDIRGLVTSRTVLFGWSVSLV